MRTSTKWLVAGGAAAFVLTPIAAGCGSSALDADLQQSGVVIDAEAANRAQAARRSADPAQAQATRSATPTAKPSPKATKKETTKKETSNKATTNKPTTGASMQPTGKKTVSAATPVTPNTPVSPVTPG